MINNGLIFLRMATSLLKLRAIITWQCKTLRLMASWLMVAIAFWFESKMIGWRLFWCRFSAQAKYKLIRLLLKRGILSCLRSSVIKCRLILKAAGQAAFRLFMLLWRCLAIYTGAARQRNKCLVIFLTSCALIIFNDAMLGTFCSNFCTLLAEITCACWCCFFIKPVRVFTALLLRNRLLCLTICFILLLGYCGYLLVSWLRRA